MNTLRYSKLLNKKFKIKLRITLFYTTENSYFLKECILTLKKQMRSNFSCINYFVKQDKNSFGARL